MDKIEVKMLWIILKFILSIKLKKSLIFENVAHKTIRIITHESIKLLIKSELTFYF